MHPDPKLGFLWEISKIFGIYCQLKGVDRKKVKMASCFTLFFSPNLLFKVRLCLPVYMCDIKWRAIQTALLPVYDVK